jgi:glutaconate CoA-transferase subunit B
VARYEHTKVEQAVKATGWPLNIAGRVDVLAPPDQEELQILRDLHERTRLAHSTPVRLRLRGETP